MLDPVQRRQYGIASLVVSAVLASISVAAFAGNAIRRDSVATEMAASNQQCEANLKALGAGMVTVTDTSAVAQWNTIEGGYTQLGQTSAAAMACPGWTMKAFCMGQECATPGAKLELVKASEDDPT